jgi:flagellar hook-basal body complex protein FliE
MEGIRRIDGEIGAPRERSSSTASTGGTSFASELNKAIGSVEELQAEADRESSKLALGGGNLHETALALEKADISMRVLVKVRNKLVDAYQEVMRMTV